MMTSHENQEENMYILSAFFEVGSTRRQWFRNIEKRPLLSKQIEYQSLERLTTGVPIFFRRLHPLTNQQRFI